MFLLDNNLDYQLIDFGEGRRLERFANIVMDRPCPSVLSESKGEPRLWKNADVAFFSADSRWVALTQKGASVLDGFECRFGEKTCFFLKGTPFGHIGLFPEQEPIWRRLLNSQKNCRVLNLFAYTGGSTLAAAASGGIVTHVDSAKNIVNWARTNARLSNLDARWIVEDARIFVQREIKRQQFYDTVILDPPSYGHGTKGESWHIDKDLPLLLKDCFALLANSQNPQLLLTCHTNGYDTKTLCQLVASNQNRMNIETFQLEIHSLSGKILQSGCGVYKVG